ncbi:MAG: hypothetical protein M1814_004837 [Vezdaea aestivalis]|nr:MAG: hypothetical protein M1814_004837 [Vezdaea aestivalis]
MARPTTSQGYYADQVARGQSVVTDLPKFDLDTHISNYEGRGKLERLLYIGQHSTLLGPDALRQGITLSKLGLDIPRYLSLVSTLAAVSPSDPFATPDQAWIDGTTATVTRESERKEAELSGYKNNLIKESIRMGYEDLARHCIASGDLTTAYKCSQRMRDHCISPQNILDAHMLQIRIALYRADFIGAQSLVQKCRHLPAPPEMLALYINRLHAALGLAQLQSSNILDAAISFLAVDPSIGNSFSTHLTPTDIAAYATLCSLASLSRVDLQRRVLNSSTFRALLDLDPPLRRAITAFVAGTYSTALTILNSYRTDWALDPYLAPLLPALFAEIRKKSLALYFEPFRKVLLREVARAFETEEKVMVKEVVRLIDAGVLKARVDLEAGVVVRVDDNGRASREGLVTEVLQGAEGFEREAKARLLRFAILGAGLEVRGKGGRRDGDGEGVGGGSGIAGLLAGTGGSRSKAR